MIWLILFLVFVVLPGIPVVDPDLKGALGSGDTRSWICQTGAEMIYPLSNAIITQYFGEHPDDYLQYGFPGHNGIDLTTDDSPPVVYSVQPGRVCQGWLAGRMGTGNTSSIEAGQNQFYYCHLAGVFMKPGDQVTEGEPIGIMGNTGNINRTTPALRNEEHIRSRESSTTRVMLIQCLLSR